MRYPTPAGWTVIAAAGVPGPLDHAAMATHLPQGELAAAAHAEVMMQVTWLATQRWK